MPFNKRVRVTVQSTNGTRGGFYFIVRGTPNLENVIGGVTIPPQAKLKLLVFNKTVNPLDFVPIVSVPSGYSGYFFMQTLAVKSDNMNFLEGCFHQYTPFNNQQFPGVVLSSGTEDYFDSAWYFNAGEFRLPVSGYTHLDTHNSSYVTWSAYRFHEMDPIVFDDGLLIHWRNGDVVDPYGLKCFTINGSKAGNPSKSDVVVYAWVYVWRK